MKRHLSYLNISVWLERLWDVCNSLLLYVWSESPNSPLCMLELCNCSNSSSSGLQDGCPLFSSFTSKSSSSSDPWLVFQKVQPRTLTTTYRLLRIQQQSPSFEQTNPKYYEQTYSQHPSLPITPITILVTDLGFSSLHWRKTLPLKSGVHTWKFWVMFHNQPTASSSSTPGNCILPSHYHAYIPLLLPTILH